MQIEIDTSNNNLVVEYMLNKVLIHDFVTSSTKFTKNVLIGNSSFYAVQQFLMVY